MRLIRYRTGRLSIDFIQPRVLCALLGLVVSTLPVAASSAGQDACTPREWAITIVDPNVLDADSYVADISIFLEHASQPRIFYARGPVNSDGWRIKSANQRTDTWRIQRLPADPGSPNHPSRAIDRVGTSCVAHGHILW